MKISINSNLKNEEILNIKSTKLFYLAYGSNLNVEQMVGWRCPGAIKIGSLYLDGYRLVFRGVADFQKEPSFKLPLGLWEITKEHEQSLDRYEGVSSGLYKKLFWRISINNVNYKALIYKMNTESLAKPRQQYLDVINKGFDDFNLDKRMLSDAVIYSTDHKVGNPYIRKIDRRKYGVRLP